jgi:hypothetical protein
MNKAPGLGTLALILLAAAAVPAMAQSRIEFDHVWIMVSPDAPERAALEHPGFQITPDVNRHDAQGTASITVEFENAYVARLYRCRSTRLGTGC